MDTADHLLVVDDDRDIRELLTNYLTRNGFRATAVADGRAMRAALAAHAFDLVVLDVMLPGEDGLTLCRELRARLQPADSDADRARRRPRPHCRAGDGG